jgi:AraC-like DNA-binding protein
VNTQYYFNLNPVNFFIISGLIQNFILVGILFLRRNEHPLANKLLAVIITIVNLHLGYLMLLDTNLDNIFPPLLWIPYSFLTAVGPLLYFYTASLTGLTLTSTTLFKHLIPVIVELLSQAVMIVYGVQHNEVFYNTPFYFFVTPVVYLWTAISILYYLRASLAIIRNHEAWAFKNFSNLKEVTLRWLQKLIVYYRILWIVWVPFVALFLLFFRFELLYVSVVLTLYVLMLVLTYLTFWIGLQGFAHMNIVLPRIEEDKPSNKNFGKLSQDQISTYAIRISSLMIEDKMYLDENLSLRDVASRLQLDANLVSFVINSHIEKNFYDFVNFYRIEEVKKRMQDPAYAHLTLLGIALESGFNSKTTFNRVFKQVTGMTPSAFLKK